MKKMLLQETKKNKVSKDSHLLSGVPIAQKIFLVQKELKQLADQKCLKTFIRPIAQKLKKH